MRPQDTVGKPIMLAWLTGVPPETLAEPDRIVERDYLFAAAPTNGHLDPALGLGPGPQS